MMISMGVEGKEAEEEFWANLAQFSEQERGEFFATARSSREAAKGAGCAVIIAVLVFLCFGLALLLS